MTRISLKLEFGYPSETGFFAHEFARKVMKGILEHAQIGDRMIKNPVSWLQVLVT